MEIVICLRPHDITLHVEQCSLDLCIGVGFLLVDRAAIQRFELGADLALGDRRKITIGNH